MSYPEYASLADALLSYIYRCGGSTFQCHAREIYEPLADLFCPTRAEREAPRPDGYSGRYWENLVQWTRQRLINEGYAESRGHGIWGLTQRGVTRARLIGTSATFT
jgi:hypothetical protein